RPHQIKVAGGKHRPVDQPHVLKPKPRSAPPTKVRILRLANRKDRPIELDRLFPPAGAGIHETMQNIAARYIKGRIVFPLPRFTHEYPAPPPKLFPPFALRRPRRTDIGSLTPRNRLPELLSPLLDRRRLRRECIYRDPML